tara:strand:+ start:3207 stop:3887 length:681 start_codon:yes stop_codon:yes gene_type:complete
MLYIVSTPIGNLEDITLRALRILGEVDIVYCEDTRVTKKLLDHYKLRKRLKSFHAQSSDAKMRELISDLKSGSNVALVSDAGTPTISDPGAKVVSEVREKLPEVSIIAIPGPSALTAGLSISGMPASGFLFLGFLPHKKGRETLFSEISQSKRTVVFYESPHRIIKTLESLEKHCSKKQIAVIGEITKIHEKVFTGKAKEIKQILLGDKNLAKGEFVVLVAPFVQK